MKKAEKELQIILNDKVHGSSEVLELVINHFLKHKANPSHLIEASNNIKKDIPHFPVVIKFVRQAERLINNKSKNEFFKFLENYKRNINERYNRLFINAYPILSKYHTILTISHSKTLIEIFKKWKEVNTDIKIIICESRPEKEGLIMAKVLSKFKLNVSIISEAMAGNIIKQVDAVIIGADQILKNGEIINKTGSRMLAILAKYHKIPIYVLATKDKIVKRKSAKTLSTLKNHRIKGSYIKRINENFEIIEKSLITKIISN
jgi:translation initiation factor 2B subunit (eIF-2B alpha/beta/delta family)